MAALSCNVSEGLQERSLLYDEKPLEKSSDDAPDIVRSSRVEVLKRKSMQQEAEAPLAKFESPRGKVVSTPPSDSSPGVVSGGEEDGRRRGRKKRAHKMPKFPFVPDSLIGDDHVETRKVQSDLFQISTSINSFFFTLERIAALPRRNPTPTFFTQS